MIIEGIETRGVKVEVDVKDFISKLLEIEIDSIRHSRVFKGEYDLILIKVKDNKLLEHYIKQGHDHGHYQKDDETVHTLDRTVDFSEDYVAHLVGLSNSLKWLSKK